MALKVISKSGTAFPVPIQWRSRLWASFGLLLSLLLVTLFACSIGSANVPFPIIWKILVSGLPLIDIDGDWSTNTEIIILETRLPRVILAGTVGASLGIAGATYQGLFRNPLADPYLIGVSHGALLGAAIGFLLPISWEGIAGDMVVPMLAFVGSAVAVIIVFLIARTGKSLPVTTLILAGVALGAFLSSITSYLIITTENERLHSIISWMLGHFSLSNWDQVIIVVPCMLLGSAVIWAYARPLNVMQLDEEQAQQLGVNVERVKLILLAAATLITAAAVAFCGTIGFVGIIIPHTVRLIWGPDYRFLLPLSVLVGAIFLILADTLARTIIRPQEIPVGVITAFVGAPFFLYLLRQRKRGTFF